MHGLNEIKSINAWAATKAAKKVARKPSKLRSGVKMVRMQGREVSV